jgi:hypothetical protein
VVAGLASAAVAASGVAGTAITRHEPHAAGDSLRLNQMQVVGSHNSYHRELSPNEQKVQQQQNPGSVDLWYSHAPISQQLEDQNVRSLELDLFPDPQGGLYTFPLIRKLTGQGPLTDPAMAQPGIKVMHVPDFDYNTNCATFKICLQQVKTWSDQHPNHVPIAINLELKQSDPNVGRGQPRQCRHRDPLGLPGGRRAVAGRRTQAGPDPRAVGADEGLAEADLGPRSGDVLLRQRWSR